MMHGSMLQVITTKERRCTRGVHVTAAASHISNNPRMMYSHRGGMHHQPGGTHSHGQPHGPLHDLVDQHRIAASRKK